MTGLAHRSATSLRPWRRRVVAVAALSTIAFAPACGGGGGDSTDTAACPALDLAATLQATLCQPRDGSEVGEVEQVRGWVAGLGDREIWLVVLASNGAHYPQPALTVAVDGSFAGTAHFGDALGGSGQTFTVQVVAAEPAASELFERYLASRSNTGLPALPETVTPLTIATVNRPD